MLEAIRNSISNIDWSQFHFLRPNALYLFVPLAVIVVLLILGNKEKKKWKRLISPSLRPFMFSKGSIWAIALPLIFFVLGSSFVIAGLAGPTWKKKELPKEKIQAVVLIALDLSKSMLADDIPPSRLERAKFKIIDFLDANPRARAGLIAYAGSAHPVLPFTPDYKLIKQHSGSLVNRIMPIQGTNIPVLLEVIDSLMKKVAAPSTVLIMTDAISSDDAVLFENYFHGSVHKLEILLFSTPNGAKVPGFPNEISKQDPSVVASFSNDSSIKLTPLTLDKSDVAGIAKRISQKLIFEQDKKEQQKDWDDIGWVLVIPALIIALFWFRKGWVIQWCLLPVSIFVLNSCGLKSKHPDWWYSKDYQGQLLENDKQFEAAADRFEDDKHKAVAYFKAGNYETAADLFELDSSAAGFYNRGLALAELGRYNEAEISFQNAINLDPGLKNAVGESLKKTSTARKKADSILKYDTTAVSKNEKTLSDNKKKDKKDPLKERKAISKDEELSSDTRVKNLPKFGNRVTDETQSDIHTAKEAKTPPKDFKPGQAEKLESKILLRQTAADPSEFLHRRFELQVRRYYQNLKKPKEAW
ncbi:MAG: hypothetical protein C5B52_15345 [Bacteroidetes bacterium]|nr:MAG: hypothetical protein C5B52_15345 [Bacteroidota bacterium]